MVDQNPRQQLLDAVETIERIGQRLVAALRAHDAEQAEDLRTYPALACRETYGRIDRVVSAQP